MNYHSELIGDIPTSYISCGTEILDSDSTKEVIVCISGNPGLVEFYEDFIREIYVQLGKKIPTLVVGHVGHEGYPPHSTDRMPKLADNGHLYDLDAQIQHKVDFITRYVPKDAKIYFIGHSIGSWMLVELMKLPEIRQRTIKCYLLFPTLERMAITRNGRFLERFIFPLTSVIIYLVGFFFMLPHFVQNFLFWIVLPFLSIPYSNINTVRHLINPGGLRRIFFLACDEMTRVQELDIETITANKHILKLYYSTTDGWVPVDYYREICKKIPGIDAHLDEHNIAHAFVLRSSKEMATIVCKWIHQDGLKKEFS
ncbi:Lipid droplet-associated hydrolase [Sergentomyia squamirostris]